MTDIDVSQDLADIRRFLICEPDGPNRWSGGVLAGWTGTQFGGFILAQAVAAAVQAGQPGDDRRLTSVHGHFLRPISGERATTINIEVLKEGKMFAHRRVALGQNGKVGLALTATFGRDHEDSYEYDLPSPAPVPEIDESMIEKGPPPWVVAWVGPTPERPDGTRASTNRKWVRVPKQLEDDDGLHAALLAYCTDWTGVGGRPLRLDGDTTGMISLDHAAWFHRPARVDEWLFIDVYSLVNAGGRGVLRGTIYNTNGQVVVSMAQEMLIAVV